MSFYASVMVPPEENGQTPDLVAYFQSHLLSTLSSVIDTGLDEFDERAQIDEVEVIEVEQDSDEISVTYEISFSAYYGCQDKNYSDLTQRTIHGRRSGMEWIFHLYVAPQKRSTLNEF